jgi:hypothetical protein
MRKDRQPLNPVNPAGDVEGRHGMPYIRALRMPDFVVNRAEVRQLRVPIPGRIKREIE